MPMPRSSPAFPRPNRWRCSRAMPSGCSGFEEATMTEVGASTMQQLLHVGITVASLDAALAFWESFLQKPARWRTVLDRPYLGRITGYPGVSIKAAFVDLPGGIVIELLDYQVEGRVPNADVTANP